MASNQRREEEIKCPNSTGNPDYGLILPREIWMSIGKRLESRLDVSRFRSVCRTWRSILPPPFRFPFQVPRPPGPGPGPGPSNSQKVSYLITEVTFYAANGLIFLFEEEYRGGEFSASALVHRRQIIPFRNMKLFELPPVTQIPNLSFLCNAFHVHNAYPRYINGNRVAGKCNFDGNLDVLKIVIICSDGAANINPNYPRLRDLKVVAHLKEDRKLAVLSLCGGAMNNNWETGFCDITFDDIVNYRGQLYGVDKFGRAFVMDYNSLRMTQVAAALWKSSFEAFIGMANYTKVMHLAVVSGDLYMFVNNRVVLVLGDVHSFINGGADVYVSGLYKLSLPLGKWLEADQDLPDHVFIQNMQCNFAVSRDLFRGHDDSNPLPRFCAWPDFEFVRVAVGFNNAYQPGRLSRHCDHPYTPYRIKLWGVP